MHSLVHVTFASLLYSGACHNIAHAILLIACCGAVAECKAFKHDTFPVRFIEAKDFIHVDIILYYFGLCMAAVAVM